jgi:hypothetical protein
MKKVTAGYVITVVGAFLMNYGKGDAMGIAGLAMMLIGGPFFIWTIPTTVKSAIDDIKKEKNLKDDLLDTPIVEMMLTREIGGMNWVAITEIDRRTGRRMAPVKMKSRVLLNPMRPDIDINNMPMVSYQKYDRRVGKVIIYGGDYYLPTSQAIQQTYPS